MSQWMAITTKGGSLACYSTLNMTKSYTVGFALRFKGDGVSYHVFPLGDLVEHDTDGDECVCGPVSIPVERDDGSVGWVLSHNALDGREHREDDHDCATLGCP